MSIFPLFDPETTLTSRFFTATFLYNRLFPGHKAESSHNPYYTAADSHIFLPAHMEAGRDKTAALAAVAGLASEVSAAYPSRKPQTQPGPGTMIARILPVHGSTSRSPTKPKRLQSQTLITSRLFNSLIRMASSPGSKHFMYPINSRPVIRAGCRQPVILSIYSLCSISCP